MDQALVVSPLGLVANCGFIHNSGMSTARLLLVTGAPATGKTSLAREVGQKYGLPVITKDDFKERLFNELGWSDRQWSRKIGKASYTLMYYILESQLQAGKSLVMESDFRPEFDEPKLRALKDKYDFASFVIRCSSDPQVILERFKNRVDDGQRHPGHDDRNTIHEFTPEVLANSFTMLNIGGRTYEFDTTDFATLNYAELWSQLDEFLATT